MPVRKRIRTQYPGVYYIESSFTGLSQLERIYYIMYRLDGRLIEEKVGRQYQDDMTAARAAYIRDLKIQGKQLPNRADHRKKTNKKGIADEQTVDWMWQQYKIQKSDLRGLRYDENRYQNHLKPKFGAKRPAEISSLDIDQLRNDLLEKKKPQTVKHILALLRRIINFGGSKEYCSKLNFTIEMPEINNAEFEILNPDELERLMKSINEDQNIQAANIMKLSLFTGMRRGELFRLKWKDVDFKRGIITTRDGNGTSGQKIPLNDCARQILTTHPKQDSPFVFPGRGGKQRVDINKQVGRIKKRAGLPKSFRPLHGLRNVYATVFASSRLVTMNSLQKILVQKNSQLPEKYIQERDEVLNRASLLAGSIIEQMINSDLL